MYFHIISRMVIMITSPSIRWKVFNVQLQTDRLQRGYLQIGHQNYPVNIQSILQAATKSLRSQILFRKPLRFPSQQASKTLLCKLLFTIFWAKESLMWQVKTLTLVIMKQSGEVQTTRGTKFYTASTSTESERVKLTANCMEC